MYIHMFVYSTLEMEGKKDGEYRREKEGERREVLLSPPPNSQPTLPVVQGY